MAAAEDDAMSIKDIAKVQTELLKAIANGNSEDVVTLDTVETQHYCEQKAVFERNESPLDENRPERLSRAQEQHEKLVTISAKAGEEYGLSDAWNDIETGDASLMYFPLAHRIVGRTLLGRPTFIRFVDCQPSQLTLVRGVTKDRYLDQLFPNERFLLWCYGSILDRIGFDVSDLSIRYLKYPQSKFKVEEISRAQILVSAEDGDDIAVKLKGESALHPHIRQHPYKYERDPDMGKQLRKYVALWRDNRSPTGANHWKQCVSCRFRPQCNLVLAEGEQRS